MSKLKFIIIAIVLCLAGITLLIFKFLDLPFLNFSPPNPSNSQSPNPAGPEFFSETFTDAAGRFSFSYSDGFVVTTQSNGDLGDTILLRNPILHPVRSQTQNASAVQPETEQTSNGAGLEIQIAVMPFDEEGPLTRERILQDLPDMVVDNPVQVLIGEKKDIPALLFSSQDEDVGVTKEVWFIHPVRSQMPSASADALAHRTSNGVHGGFLYQVSALAANEAELGKFLEGWKFNQ